MTFGTFQPAKVKPN